MPAPAPPEGDLLPNAVAAAPGKKAARTAIPATGGIQKGASTHHQEQPRTPQSFSTTNATPRASQAPMPPLLAIALFATGMPSFHAHAHLVGGHASPPRRKRKSRRGRTPKGVRPRRLTRQRDPRPGRASPRLVFRPPDSDRKSTRLNSSHA